MLPGWRVGEAVSGAGSSGSWPEGMPSREAVGIPAVTESCVGVAKSIHKLHIDAMARAQRKSKDSGRSSRSRASKQAITLRLDPAKFRQLELLARAENRTPTNYVETVVPREMEAKEEAARVITMLVPREAAELAPRGQAFHAQAGRRAKPAPGIQTASEPPSKDPHDYSVDPETGHSQSGRNCRGSRWIATGAV